MITKALSHSHDIKFDISFLQAADDIIELIVTELIGNIWEEDNSLRRETFLVSGLVNKTSEYYGWIKEGY